MPDEPNDKPEPDIKSDESWKDRVKAEDAKLDAERTGAAASPDGERPEPAPEPAAEEDFDPSLIPPADFAVLVQSFSTQAMVALGLIPHPATGEAKAQPALAKHFIDLLGVIEEKTAGNLTNPERNLLVDALHHLRIAYVELTKQTD